MAMHLTRRGLVALVAVATLLGSNVAAEAAPFQPGNVVILRVGDGTTAPTANVLPVSLLEYQITYVAGVPTAASVVQTINVQSTTATSGNRAANIGGTAALEGSLNLSSNGQYLVFGGYNNNVGGGGASSASTIARVLGRVDLAGNVDTTTALTFNAGTALRSVASTDGIDLWAGNGSGGSTGVRATTFGSTGTSFNTLNTNNLRRVDVFNNQLYLTQAAASIHGVATVGTGTPTSGSQTANILPGMPTTSGPGPVDFFFADASTLYVADDRSTADAGGLEKWKLISGTWQLQFTLSVDTVNTAAADQGLRGLTGSVDESGNVTLFATTTFGTAGTPNFLYGFTDTLANTVEANVTVNQLASAGTNFTFRGLEVLPVPEPGGVIGLAALGFFALRRRRA